MCLDPVFQLHKCRPGFKVRLHDAETFLYRLSSFVDFQDGGHIIIQQIGTYGIQPVISGFLAYLFFIQIILDAGCHHFFGAFHQLIFYEDGNGNQTRYQYDEKGLPESVRDKEGRVRSRKYDLAGNVAAEIFPSGEAVSYEYDRENRLKKAERTAEGGKKTGTVVGYAYDLAGNLLKVEAGDGKKVLSVISYEYDALNRVVAVTDPAGGKTLYGYDRYSGRVSSITNPMGNWKSYCYDAAGELTEETDIKGNATRYTYDILGKLTSVTDGPDRTTEYSYLPGGRLEKVVLL